MELKLCLLSQLQTQADNLDLSSNTWDSAQSPCEVGGQVQALLKATKLEKVEKTTSNCCLEQGLFS